MDELNELFGKNWEKEDPSQKNLDHIKALSKKLLRRVSVVANQFESKDQTVLKEIYAGLYEIYQASKNKRTPSPGIAKSDGPTPVKSTGKGLGMKTMQSRMGSLEESIKNIIKKELEKG